MTSLCQALMQNFLPFSRELDSLRAETQSAQTESATQASKASQIMSMNLKLQSSVSKNQAKNIDLELRKIEAREARELLSIVQVRANGCHCSTHTHACNSHICLKYMLKQTVTRQAATSFSKGWH
jgi:dynactin 1